MGGSVSEFLINLETEYADPQDTLEADRRAQIGRDTDPFPSIPAALLSHEHIEAYVKQTAMVHPFYPGREVWEALDVYEDMSFGWGRNHIRQHVYAMVIRDRVGA